MPIITTYSEVGGHAVNEDAFAVVEEKDFVACALADGQGGQPGGGPAARLACTMVLDSGKQIPPKRLADMGTWVTLLQRADEAVANDNAAGLTTLISLCVTNGWVYGASNGDSAARLFLSTGKNEDLTARQNKNPPIGSGGAVPVPFSARLKAPWKLLVMSDGVWKYVGQDRLYDVARREQGQNLVDALLQEARGRESKQLWDDFTLVVFEENM